MVKIYRTPFSNSGDKQAIPVATDPQGFVSDETGFTGRYELADSDPNYLPIERAEMNGILNEITGGLGELQQFGFAKWQAGTWVKDSRCVHNAIVYRATVQTTQSPPHADWMVDSVAPVQATGQSTTAIMSQKAVTDALNTRGAIAGSNATNGYVKLDNGLIIQWGYVGSNTTVIFPVAFPAVCTGLAFSRLGFGTNADINQVGDLTKTQFEIRGRTPSGDYISAYSKWIAIGY